MQFALRIICNRKNIEAVKGRAAALTKYLSISDDLTFSPYWKDSNCAILELHTTIETPDYDKILQYV